METHNHNHEAHNHGKAVVLNNVNNAFLIGIVLNLLYVIIQIIIGLRINSLSLLSDAGHNFLDVGALALSLLAFKLNKAKTSDNANAPTSRKLCPASESKDKELMRSPMII